MNTHNTKEFKSAKIGFNNQFILQCVSHMRNTKSLDQRCFYLTIHQKSNFKENRGKIIYFKLNNLLFSRSFAKGQDRIGMIIDEDQEGSRTGKSSGFGKHYHALVFLPSNTKLLKRSSEEICFEISNILEVGHIDCRKYEMNQSLGQVIDYSSKYSRQNLYDGKKLSNMSGIYPYDLDYDSASRKLHDRTLRHIQQRYDDLLIRFYGARPLNPSCWVCS